MREITHKEWILTCTFIVLLILFFLDNSLEINFWTYLLSLVLFVAVIILILVNKKKKGSKDKG
ncbi:hypothetical protein HOE37_04470 [Candidatus Woesearchaeota archaeon]|nr:hypothetical protein [Candidatus Woesearchaeota archaeon]MBT4111086.1 hypothetical protein [Candidatus Woesearchaeota archaeon]MBT4335730.1 hypothetical protein [Candidatus Woesearchaeota archaeon]MBT4469253.1 hypothetical protein [Candidatus Woesearchaeota archaeon]MBT6744225.1 hypothetical protein [Candidatus Woesearchaeota archaeon]